jgi:hypothetical protein
MWQRYVHVADAEFGEALCEQILETRTSSNSGDMDATSPLPDRTQFRIKV